MGASSSGLLEEAKISHIKALADCTFQSFSVFYHQQYSSAYCRHLQQEVEPKEVGRDLLLTQRPQSVADGALYQGTVQFCWYEQGKKCREKYVVLRRDYRVEIHDNIESFDRGCTAKLVLQPAGGTVLTTQEESRALLEQICAGVLNGAKEDSPSVTSSPDVFAVYLHLPYTDQSCFLFQQEEARDHFLSVLKTCIRHCNLDPWCELSYESQAYVRALRLYRQDKGCYESWEMLLGTEEQVLASQVMEEVLPWLQNQLRPKLKGKKAERIRQWLSTVHAAYTLVLELLTASLEDLRENCRQTALANQLLIRSNLDQIMSSLSFLEQKVKVCICEKAENVYSESVAPYMSSILEVLTENISAGIQGMQHTLHTQMDTAFTCTNGETDETEKALLILRSIRLDQCYRQVKNLADTLVDLKQRFGLNSTQRLVHSAHLEMEQLLDSVVYTFELFLQSSSRLQPSHVPVKMERAKERVLKQLDYDSRVVQRRLYQDALLEITLPTLTKTMDSKWKTELQQFEHYIFSDYSSFILVQNVYDDVLRGILSAKIETVVMDIASQKSNNLLLDISDLATSEYSLLGRTPPCSAPGSPGNHARHSPSAEPEAGGESAPVVEEVAQTVSVHVQSNPQLNAEAKSDSSTTQDSSSNQSTEPLSHDEPATEEASPSEDVHEDVQLQTDTSLMADSATADSGSSDPSAVPEPINAIPDFPGPSVSTLSSQQSTDVPAQCAQSDQSAATETSVMSDQIPEVASSVHLSSCPALPQPSHTSDTDSPTKISLESLNEAISCSATADSVMQTVAQPMTDRAVYLTGQIKDSWEVERLKEETERETETDENEVMAGDEENESGLKESTDDIKKAEWDADHAGNEEQGKKMEEELLQSSQPVELQPEDSVELPLDSVAIIRELVTETTEVETLVSLCPTSSNTP